MKQKTKNTLLEFSVIGYLLSSFVILSTSTFTSFVAGFLIGILLISTGILLIRFIYQNYDNYPNDSPESISKEHKDYINYMKSWKKKNFQTFLQNTLFKIIPVFVIILWISGYKESLNDKDCWCSGSYASGTFTTLLFVFSIYVHKLNYTNHTK